MHETRCVVYRLEHGCSGQSTEMSLNHDHVVSVVAYEWVAVSLDTSAVPVWTVHAFATSASTVRSARMLSCVLNRKVLTRKRIHVSC